MPLDSELESLRARALTLRCESWRPRRERLRALRRAFVERRRQLQEAVSADLGRPAVETDILEYLPVLTALDRAIASVRRWSRPRMALTPLALTGASSRIVPQPKGVCLILSPWNYPAGLALGPLVSCIAAGNAAVLKPSEFAPATCRYLRDLIGAAFDPAVVSVVEGGPETAESLLAQPFDHIFFTGSPRVGRMVMAAAAKGPTSVTLELGGKCPAVVLADANIADAARKLVWGKFVNAGQTCIAPDYVLAEAAVASELKAALAKRIREVYPAETGEGRRGRDYTAIITPRHAERLRDLIEDARARGANVVVGGVCDPEARFVAPTLIEGVTPEMRLDQEEIFGPILPVRVIDSLGDGMFQMRIKPPPLASYIFTASKVSANCFIGGTASGATCVNHVLIHYGNDKLPFGGVGPSGIGRSQGKAGFEAFSDMRGVMRDYFSPTRLFFPPYTERTRRLLRVLLTMMRGA